MARSPIPHRKPGLRPRKVKAVSTPPAVRKPSPYPPRRAEEGKSAAEGKKTAVQPVKTRARALNPDIAVQPSPADASQYKRNPAAPATNLAQLIDEPNRDTAVQAPPAAPSPYNMNMEALAKNMAQLVEEGGRAVSAYLMPREGGIRKMDYSNEIADVVTTLGQE